MPLSRPSEGVPPSWHVALNYLGLFFQYFTGTLVVALLISRAMDAIRERRGKRDLIAQLAVIGATLLAAIVLFVKPPDTLNVAVDLAFALAVVALVAAGIGRTRDLGAQLGLATVAIPLLIHTLNFVGTRFLWPETAYDGKIIGIEHAGVMAL